MLGYDIIQLAALLFLTGGIANPFAILFLAPLTIAATSLALRQTLGLLGLALICVTVLARWSLPIPWVGGERLILPPLYVFGLWIALAVSAAFVTFYAYRVAAEAGQTASALAATELVLARAQHASQLDGLAAAAAHELSTPLATIALVAREMAAHPGPDEASTDDLQLLEQSVDRCRFILGKLSAPRDLSSQGLEFSSPVELAEVAAAPHRLLGVSITVEGEGPDLAPKCSYNPGVLSALGNLIENAVGFAEKAVNIRATWTRSTVGIAIVDDGPGFPPNILARIGEPYLSQRKDPGRNQGAAGGHGLGLFIAGLFIKRSGGVLRVRERQTAREGRCRHHPVAPPGIRTRPGTGEGAVDLSGSKRCELARRQAKSKSLTAGEQFCAKAPAPSRPVVLNLEIIWLWGRFLGNESHDGRPFPSIVDERPERR